MNIKICPTCEAKWIDGQHYWSTGKKGSANSELDLAGLVCNPFSKGRECINPCRGQEGGDTWEKREAHINLISEELS
jgi:hypothetical protein